MPIYTVREAVGKAKAHPELETRGLNARAVTMTSLDPIALPDYPQTAYHLYSKLLPAFLLATKTKEVLPTTRPGYNLIEKIENCMPLEPPNVTVTFSQKLSAEEVETLKSRGAGVVPNKDETRVQYCFGYQSVDKDLLSFLYRHSKKVNSRCASPAGSVNLATVQSYFKVNAIFTWFLRTQSYPAFTGPVDQETERKHAFDTIEGFITTKRKVAQKSTSKRARLETTNDDEDDDEDEMDVEVDYLGIDEMMFGDEVSKIPKAKPSTPPDTIYGSIATLPALPGLSFPYFEGIVESDTAFVSSVIREYFLESLGDTRDAIIQGYKDLKLHMGSLAITKQGRVLQHIACGIKLAIMGQARLYPIFENNRYVGFTLHGYYFAVSLDGYKHTPLLNAELVKEVQSIDEHNVALAKILQKLSKMKLEDTHKVPTKRMLQDAKPTCSNPRALAALIRKFDLTDDDRTEIEELATALSFPQRFWVIDNKTIIAAIDLLLSGEFPSNDIPLYPRGGTLTTRDVRLSIFASFGDQAFSLRLAGGTAHKVPKDIASDSLFKPYKGKNQKEVTPKPNIIIAKKSLSLCLEDWAAFLGDHVIYTKQSRDAMFRCVVLGGDRAKDFWYDLIKRVGSLVIDDSKKVTGPEFEFPADSLDGTVDTFADFL